MPGEYEYYQVKPIIYSLGNFIFNNDKPLKDWGLGYMAQLSFDLENRQFASLKLIPYKPTVELGSMQLLTDQEKKRFNAH